MKGNCLTPDQIIENLEKYELKGFSHTNGGLVKHLKGTFDILKAWECSMDLCNAGLCHSLYGTESYRREPIPLDEREYVRKIIGKNSEHLVYLFGAHVKDSLWENIDKSKDYKIFDRFIEQSTLISKTESQIQKLEEYRQSLISAAVTGKIDVRQEAVA